jgi:hypothetical protein
VARRLRRGGDVRSRSTGRKKRRARRIFHLRRRRNLPAGTGEGSEFGSN